MTNVPQDTTASLLTMMANACQELHGVREKLSEVIVLSTRLQTLEQQLETITRRLDCAAKTNEETQKHYMEQSNKHQVELATLNIRLQGYEEIKKKVDSMNTKIAVGGVLVAFSAIVIQAGPAWLERFDKFNHQILPSTYSSGEAQEK